MSGLAINVQTKKIYLLSLNTMLLMSATRVLKKWTEQCLKEKKYELNGLNQKILVLHLVECVFLLVQDVVALEVVDAFQEVLVDVVQEVRTDVALEVVEGHLTTIVVLHLVRLVVFTLNTVVVLDTQ